MDSNLARSVLPCSVLLLAGLLTGCAQGVQRVSDPVTTVTVTVSVTATPEPDLEPVGPTAPPDADDCDYGEGCMCPPSELEETDRIAAALPWHASKPDRDPDGCALSVSVKGTRASVTDDLPQALRAVGYGSDYLVTIIDYESRGYGADADGRWLNLLVREAENRPGFVDVAILLYAPPPDPYAY
jgi:hypothetical protein